MHILSKAFPRALHNLRTSLAPGKFSWGQKDFHRTSRTRTPEVRALAGPKFSCDRVILHPRVDDFLPGGNQICGEFFRFHRDHDAARGAVETAGLKA
jgi:hypothetical protein